MVARAPSPLIALAAGLLAASLGFMPGEGVAAPPAAGNSLSAWFNHSGSSNSPQAAPVTSVANADDDGPLDKLSAGFSNMGKSVKKVFTRSSQKTTNAHPKPKTEDDALTLSKPARPGADFYISLAHFQERAGNHAGAIEQYKRALEVEPTSLPALLAMARLYDGQGQLVEAMKYYEQATASHPNQPAVHNDEGLCYARQEKYSQAIACLQKAVELQPDRVLYRNNLATVQIETGQIDEAIETLAAVHGKTVAHYNVGFLLNRRNRTADALKQFKLAAASDPSFDAARQWIDTLSTKLANEPKVQSPAKPADSLPSQNAVATFVKPPATTDQPALSQTAAATPSTPTKPADPSPSRSAFAKFFNPPSKSADATPLTSATPPASATAAKTSPDESTPDNPPADPRPDSKAVAVAPETRLVSKDPPIAPVEPSEVPDTKSEPAAELATSPPPSTQRGPYVSRMHKAGNSDNSKPRDNPKPHDGDTQRSQTAALLAQRPTRLPPTPDQLQDYSRGAPAVDVTKLIVPLPPVDPEHYPASRY